MVSGRKAAMKIVPSRAKPVYNQKVPYMVSELVSVRKVMEMTRLASQFTVVATDVPVLLAQRG